MTETRQEKIQRLARESYEVATAKGWHDSDELDENGMPTVRQLLQWCALFHTEVTEYEKESAHYYFESDGKPCGKLSELADVVIRVWDAMGRLGFAEICHVIPYIASSSLDIRERIDSVTEMARVSGSGGCQNDLMLLVDEVFHCAYYHDLTADMFLSIIENKMNFNRSRSYRHGGKLA